MCLDYGFSQGIAGSTGSFTEFSRPKESLKFRNHDCWLSSGVESTRGHFQRTHFSWRRHLGSPTLPCGTSTTSAVCYSTLGLPKTNGPLRSLQYQRLF